MNRTRTLSLLVLLTIACSAGISEGAPIHADRRIQLPNQALGAVEIPYITFRVHRVGNIGFNISNTGYFGNRKDGCTGLNVPSLEFPLHSGIEYNFAGGLWIGAVIGKDTLVSLAITGGSGVGGEFFPRSLEEGGDIVERTTRPVLRQQANSMCDDVFFSADAVSEQDFVAVFSDTLGRAFTVGGGANEASRPLGIEVTQKSYSWSTEYARDFVLMDYTLKNVGNDTLKELYMGIFMDQDVFGPGGTFSDDITGFTHSVPSPMGGGFLDTLNLAWIADNDGDPGRDGFSIRSPTGVTGIRVIKAPGDVKFSFNWWISNSSAAADWGPNKADHTIPYLGNLGTPGTDKAHYAIMSNGEFDYPQWEAALDHTADGWLPPLSNSALAANLADGFDTRYVLSFGPFELLPDSSLPLVFALVAGEDFHVNPRNFSQFFDASNPSAWLENLNLDDFALNAIWAGWVYDSPGLDTDGDGYRGKYRIIDGDTAYYTGDGIPDYQGPPPPPPPTELKHTAVEGLIKIRWNGHISETTKDPFSFLPDFEGYRVYMSRTLKVEDFAMVTSRDNINFVRKKYRAANGRWKVYDPPFTLDSLKILYDHLSDSLHGHLFHPDSFKVDLRDKALVEIELNEVDPSRLDTNYYTFIRFDSNNKVNDTLVAYQVDSLHHDVIGIIRKVYPYNSPNDSLLRDMNGMVVLDSLGMPLEWPYYEYEYVINGLQLAEPVFLSVTAFDFGNPAAGLSSLESSPVANATEIWPINSAAVVKRDRPKPGVYPNPYRLADDYNAQGWENPRGLEPDPERSRKVTFTNVPDTCTISIWSLDGDLVRKLDHAELPGHTAATVVEWNLISRNTQAVKSGIYIYTIESRFGTDIGKLVIIK